MPVSKSLGRGANGAELFRFSDYIIVIKESTVITIKPYYSAADHAPDVEETLKQTIRKTIKRLLRPHLTRQQEILIEIHTQELKKLRVHNPETQSIIGGRIADLYEQLEFVKRQINSVSTIAYQHGVQIEEE